MSSIFGKCHKDAKPIDPIDLKIMKDELDHWGADGSGIWVNEKIGLGHLMLHNTPESINETQPLYNNLLQLSITADARIDNREELYAILQISTPEEKQIPDSSIILLLYKKYGADCVKHLIGDFAFAIWDNSAQKLFCARDQMGVKPFFYYNGDDFFAFATEKKGLLCLPGIDKTIDKQFYYNQLLWPRIQAADTTLYKRIRRLKPAHTLTLYSSTYKIQFDHYWTLDAYKEITLPRKETYYEELLHHFEAAVKCRSRSIYPIGAELSGGIDSSAITGVASHFLKKENRNIITFSNVDDSDKTKGTDREFAEEVIKFNDIKDFVFVTKDLWDDPIDEIEFLLRVNDGLEMWSLPWQIPVKAAAAARNVRTLLSGFPGDEMVTYRGQYYLLDLFEKKEYRKYFSAKSEMEFNKLKVFMPADVAFIFHKLRNILTINSKKIRSTADFFKIPLYSRYNKGDVVWEDNTFRERYRNYRHFQKYRLLKPQVPLRMETETRFGLSFKTEPRFPMADIRLTQFYLSMPNKIKYEGELSRNAFRNATKKYLPDKVLHRDDKSGNTAPFRTTSDAMDKRNKAILKLLSMGNNNISSAANTEYNKNIQYQVALLELLIWHKKNGQSL